jgi:hypothetical protein
LARMLCDARISPDTLNGRRQQPSLLLPQPSAALAHRVAVCAGMGDAQYPRIAASRPASNFKQLPKKSSPMPYLTSEDLPISRHLPPRWTAGPPGP